MTKNNLRLAAVPSADRFIKAAEVVAQTSLSRATIWRLIRAKKFPPSYMLSPGRKGWRQVEIDAWIEARAADVVG